MQTDLKKIVKDKYAAIASQSEANGNCGCCGDQSTQSYTILSDDYENLAGYAPEADLQLGCGVPTGYAGINAGDTVVDLGSGAGNDVFVSRALVGPAGRVIGIDMTEEMIRKARANNDKLGYDNVEFRLGDIEDLPLENDTADVVISNCVLNLVPDKEKAFRGIYRVLKPGAHFCISDIVLLGELPEKLRESAEMYAGCISGALQQDVYLALIRKSGFRRVEIKQSKPVVLPDELLRSYLSEDEIVEFRRKRHGVFSITLVAIKE